MMDIAQYVNYYGKPIVVYYYSAHKKNRSILKFCLVFVWVFAGSLPIQHTADKNGL